MNMLCPCCRAPLEEGGMEPLETSEEHICIPNGLVSYKMSYRCSDATCPTREAEIMWNASGERYGGYSFDHKKFIAGNDGPFGSYSRKSNVEIYKKGLPDRKELFTIGDVRFNLEFSYQADENGNVLKRGWYITKWKREKGGRGWFSYEFPLVSFLHEIRDGIKRGWTIRNSSRKPNGIGRLSFCVSKWEDRWWRLWSVKVNRFLFPSLAKELPFRGM